MATRGELISLFRSLVDDKGIGSLIFTDERIREFLYQGAQEVQDQIVELDEKFFIDVTSINVLADQTSVAFPVTARQIIRVTRTDTNPTVQFKQIDLRNLEFHRGKYGNVNTYETAFALRGLSLIYPSPMGANHTIEVECTTQVANLADDAESWSTIPVSAHRQIAFEAALIALVAEDSDTSKMEKLVERMRYSLIKHMSQRGRTGPRYVNDRSEQ